MAEQLQVWQAAQAARLKHMTIQLHSTQVEVVEEALETAMAGAVKNNDNPNRRGNALYHLCQQDLQTIRETS